MQLDGGSSTSAVSKKDKPEVSEVIAEQPSVEAPTGVRLKKSEERQLKKRKIIRDHLDEKALLERKYDINLLDSDDSSDEEVLLRTGDVPQRWYDLYDHKGYSVDGKKVGKMLEKDELQKFVEKSEDP